MAQSLFKTLKANQPNCTIDVAAPAWTMPLLERMPEVDHTIALPFKHGELAFWKRIAFGRRLKDKAYTQAIILTNSFKSALIPWAAQIPKRTSYLGELRYGLINDIRPLDKTVLKKTVERFVSLGLPPNQTLPMTLQRPSLLTQKDHSQRLLDKFAIETSNKAILGLCPGAEYGEAKRWPAEHYAEVANAAIANGWQVWLFGSVKDGVITESINKDTQNRCINLAGKTSLGEAIDLMALCNTIISNDSGLMHVAAALDKKLIAVFGSSDPYHTPPMHPKAIIHYLGLPCSPCFKRECPLEGEAHLACLKNISALDVMSSTSP